MSKNERMSKLEIPGWWLAKVIPLLESPAVKHAEVARAASIHAGRRSAWDQSAISCREDHGAYEWNQRCIADSSAVLHCTDGEGRR